VTAVVSACVEVIFDNDVYMFPYESEGILCK